MWSAVGRWDHVSRVAIELLSPGSYGNRTEYNVVRASLIAFRDQYAVHETESSAMMIPCSNQVDVLLHSDDWAIAARQCDDIATVREVVVCCAEVVLPYWQSRFHRDEAMEALTSTMRRFADNPNHETQAEVRSRIPTDRLPRKWDLSPVFELDSIGSDCPADFAGDAIAYCALALVGFDLSIERDNLYKAIDTTIETIARLFGERDTDDDSDVDHVDTAKEYLRQKLIERTQELALREND